MAEKPPTPSQMVNVLREKTDMQDKSRNEAMYSQGLEKDNYLFIQQMRQFVERGGEDASSAFGAIEATAKQLGIAPLEIVKLLNLPAVDQLVEQSVYSDLVNRSGAATLSDYDVYKEFYTTGKKVDRRLVESLNNARGGSYRFDMKM